MSAARAFQAPEANEASCGRTGATFEAGMIEGSSVVTGTVGMSACARPGVPASPATSARSAARLPGSGMRTVRIGTPFSDDTTCAFNCASRACIWATVAPGASSSSSCVRTYSTPFSSDTSPGAKLAAALITS